MQDNGEQKQSFQKNDAFAGMIGMELLEMGDGRATARMALTQEHKNGWGATNGGVVFSLADFAMAAAANSRGFAVAVCATVNWVKPAKGAFIVAEAEEVSLSKRIGNYRATIRDENNETVAVATGTLYRKPA